jgi:tRNA pseudouridine38-40 synthase
LTAPTQRILLVVQYDGTGFHGSQVQPGVRTVQGTLTEALSEIVGRKVRLLFASRTDAGVHATHNTAVAVMPRLPFPVAKLADVLNDKLPRDLVVVDAFEVPRGFHPRYYAWKRDYCYRIDRGRRPDIRYARFAAHYPHPLEVPAMQLAAQLFLGEHDFSSFAIEDEGVKNPVCTVYKCILGDRGRLLTVRVGANRFLRRMVCLMVGSLVDIGNGRFQLDQLAGALERQERQHFTNMPGRGLTLTGVHYPERLLYEGSDESADDDEETCGDTDDE